MPALASEDVRDRPAAGLTPREFARLLRVSPDRVRGWIRSGKLKAINTATLRCAKPRFIILPAHLEEFAAQNLAGCPKPVHRRRRAPMRDYYP